MYWMWQRLSSTSSICPSAHVPSAFISIRLTTEPRSSTVLPTMCVQTCSGTWGLLIYSRRRPLKSRQKKLPNPLCSCLVRTRPNERNDLRGVSGSRIDPEACVQGCSRVTGKPYLGITSRLPVTRAQSLPPACRGLHTTAEPGRENVGNTPPPLFLSLPLYPLPAFFF